MSKCDLLRFSRSFLICYIIFYTLLLNYGLLYSQSALKIYGQVIDRNGPVSGACVSVENTVYRTTTGNDGYYYIFDIPPGEYRLSCNLSGITTLTSDKIKIGNGLPVRRDIFLENNLINTAPVYARESYPVTVQNQSFSVRVYDIQEKNNESVEALLKDIPGINIISSPATGEIFLSAGGIRADGLNVLIDGRKINSLLTGRADISQIPVRAITRIELFSPGITGKSTGGGLGGTINFVTDDRDRTNSFEFSAQSGSFQEEGYSAELNYHQNDYGDINIIWEKQLKKNNYAYYDYFGDTQIRENAFLNHSKYYFSYANVFERNYFNMSGYFYDGRNGIPGQIISLKSKAASDKKALSAGGELSRLLGVNNKLKISVSYTGRESEFRDYSSFFPYYSIYNTKYIEHESEIAVCNNYMTSDWLTINSGLLYKKSVLEGIDNLRPSYALGKKQRLACGFNEAIYLNYNIRKFSLKSGLSYSLNNIDNHNHSAESFSSSITYDNEVSTGLISSYSKAFRLPGLAELHWHEDVFVVANPDLKPETSRSISTEVFCSFGYYGNWRLSLEYRDIRYRNLIYWRRSQGIKYKPVNVSASDFFGLVASFSYESPGEIIGINFSRESSTALNREDNPLYYGKYVIHQPSYINRLGIEFKYRTFFADIDMLDSGCRYITEENTKKLNPYTVVDVSSGYYLKFKPVSITLEFKITNLTDKIYELLEYQPMPPRSYRLGLTVKI